MRLVCFSKYLFLSSGPPIFHILIPKSTDSLIWPYKREALHVAFGVWMVIQDIIQKLFDAKHTSSDRTNTLIFAMLKILNIIPTSYWLLQIGQPRIVL